MTPKPPPSVVPAPPNYAVPEFSFPNAIPGRQPPHSDFVLWPEVTPQGFPVTPPIPPTVQTGDVITAAHENTVSTAINDLWIDLQSLGSTTITDPTQAQGDLIVRTTTALSRLIVGANGTLLTADNTKPEGMRWATVASTGAVPSTRQVLAGTGMTGGGPLSADVTLNAKVTSVNGQIGAVVLAAADISGAVPNTRTITPADATLIVAPAGGALSSNLTFQVAPDTSIQKIRYSKDGVLVGTRREVNLIPGANVTISVTDDGPNNRINVNLAAAGGGSGGMTDPTVNPGDLIVRGTSTTTNLAVGTVGQVLTVDTVSGLKMKWAAQAVGVAPTRRIDTTAPALTGGGDLTQDLVLTVNPDTIVQKHITSYNGTQVGTRRETNFIPGSNVSLLVADDTANNRVNVTISSTAVGGAQSPWTSDINAAGFTLYSAGKVGIGIALPQAPLHVVSSSVTAGMIETTAASGGVALLNLKTATSLWQVAAGGAASALPGCWWIYDQTSAGTRLVIGPSGNVGVGVGTNVPGSLFQVGQGSPLAAGIADFYGPDRTLAAGTALVNILSTDAAAADKGGTLGLGGVSGSPSAYAFAILAGRSESASGPYAGYFQLCTVNSASVVTERMRVTSTGSVGIGTTNPGAARLAVSGGDVYIIGGNVGIGNTAAVAPSALTATTRLQVGSTIDANAIGQLVVVGNRNTVPAQIGEIDFANYALGGTEKRSAIILASTDSIGAYDNAYMAFYTMYAGSPTEKLRITAAGNVGIGTTSPGSRLQVTQSASGVVGPVITLENSQGSLHDAGSIKFVDASLRAELRFSVDSSPFGADLIYYGGGAGPTEVFRATSAGNVGIGTAGPSALCHLVGGSGYLLKMTNLGVREYGWGVTGTGLTLDDVSGAQIRMFIGATGNVFIGHGNAPAYKLDVAGDVNCSGLFRVNGAAAGTISGKQDVTGSRALNAVYGNSVGKPIFVSVTATVNSSQYMQLLTDGGNPPGSIAAAATNTNTTGSTGNYTVSAWVMTGQYYKVFMSGGSLTTWIEWY